MQSLPAGIARLAPPVPGARLAVVDSLRAPLRRGDAEAWLAAARELERDWFQALGDALAAHGRIRVVLPAERDTAVFDLSRGSRWRLFRRSRPLQSHA